MITTNHDSIISIVIDPKLFLITNHLRRPKSLMQENGDKFLTQWQFEQPIRVLFSEYTNGKQNKEYKEQIEAIIKVTKSTIYDKVSEQLDEHLNKCTKIILDKNLQIIENRTRNSMLRDLLTTNSYIKLYTKNRNLDRYPLKDVKDLFNNKVTPLKYKITTISPQSNNAYIVIKTLLWMMNIKNTELYCIVDVKEFLSTFKELISNISEIMEMTYGKEINIITLEIDCINYINGLEKVFESNLTTKIVIYPWRSGNVSKDNLPIPSKLCI